MLNAQTQLEVIANNLANASTSGFKRDGVAFNEGLMRAMSDHSGRGRSVGEMGSVQQLTSRFTDFTQGALQLTGNALDVAVRGEGMFAVQSPAGVRYTRDGAFQVDGQGRLVTKDGDFVLNVNGETISGLRPGTKIEEDGRLSLDGATVGRVGVWTGEFTKEGLNRYTGSNPRRIEAPMLASGALEMSNVNAVDEMISMIRLQRAFEMAQKTVLSHEEMTQRLIQGVSSR